jgi:hypothetical protein
LRLETFKYSPSPAPRYGFVCISWLDGIFLLTLISTARR